MSVVAECCRELYRSSDENFVLIPDESYQRIFFSFIVEIKEYRKRERDMDSITLSYTMKYCSRNRDTYSRKENKIIGHLKPRNSLFLLYGYNDILDWNEIRVYPTREHKSQIRNPWKSNDI